MKNNPPSKINEMMVVVSSYFILILEKALNIYLDISYFDFSARVLMVSE